MYQAPMGLSLPVQTSPYFDAHVPLQFELIKMFVSSRYDTNRTLRTDTEKLALSRCQ